MPFDDARPYARPLPPPDAFNQNDPGESWRRLLAACIDGIVVWIFATLLWSILWWSIPLWIPLGDLNLAAFLSLWSIYNAALIAIWSTTPGKRAFGLYVARSDGSKVSPGMALARSLASIVSTLTIIGILLIVFRQDKRGLHDLICDTVVIRRRR